MEHYHRSLISKFRDGYTIAGLIGGLGSLGFAVWFHDYVADVISFGFFVLLAVGMRD